MSEKLCTLNNEVRNTLPSMRPEFWNCVDAYWLQKTDTHLEEKPVLKFQKKLMFCFEEFETRTVGHTFRRINNIISEPEHALNTSAFGPVVMYAGPSEVFASRPELRYMF